MVFLRTACGPENRTVLDHFLEVGVFAGFVAKRGVNQYNLNPIQEWLAANAASRF